MTRLTSSVTILSPNKDRLKAGSAVFEGLAPKVVINRDNPVSLRLALKEIRRCYRAGAIRLEVNLNIIGHKSYS
jgi:hypothetical protein